MNLGAEIREKIGRKPCFPCFPPQFYIIINSLGAKKMPDTKLLDF
jgi:hypothetical protein